MTTTTPSASRSSLRTKRNSKRGTRSSSPRRALSTKTRCEHSSRFSTTASNCTGSTSCRITWRRSCQLAGSALTIINSRPSRRWRSSGGSSPDSASRWFFFMRWRNALARARRCVRTLRTPTTRSATLRRPRIISGRRSSSSRGSMARTVAIVAVCSSGWASSATVSANTKRRCQYASKPTSFTKTVPMAHLLRCRRRRGFHAQSCT
mmetsp:Transcript_88378/g.248986  ORF Transcript_88378/g.248986 Transcript_88378/m.248986 type:complete len:207 (-) Transcript_88378:2096-2716(-)